MMDAVICRELLECILQIKIKQLNLVNSQQVLDPLLNAKSVRLDIYAVDEEGTLYNIEMQLQNKSIVKRSRYYQGTIDLDRVKKGSDYEVLGKSYIIFICTFDPFGKGKSVYSFQNSCDQDKDLVLGDESYKVFLNTKGTSGNISGELKEFLDYVEYSTEETAKSCKSLLVKKIHKKVEEIRGNNECEVEFMLLIDKYREIEEEAREKGLREGKKEGQKEGKEEGQKELILRMIQRKLSIEKISEITGMPEEEIKVIIE